MRRIWLVLSFLFLIHTPAFTQESCLLNDLMVVEYWNCQNALRVPVTYNHLLLGGYFNMPSARMGEDGELGLGYASVPPYLIWSGRCQIIDRLELTGNYRIFSGVEDPVLSKHGFGDFSDKGANIKFAIIKPEDSGYKLPGVAIGFEDFLGTRNFKTHYLVATQVFKDFDFEFTVGYGKHRYNRWFGGIQWFPFKKLCLMEWWGPLALIAEYDATNYKKDPHCRGREQHCPINAGLKYRLWDAIDFSLAYVRGRKIAGSVSAYYNFGSTEGFFPKIDSPLPYRAPVNLEPVNDLRPPEWLAAELIFTLRKQGFQLLEASIFYDDCLQQALHLRVVNEVYRREKEMRQRLSSILAALVPNDFSYVTVVIDAEGFPVQEYTIPIAFLRRYGERCLCEQEFITLSPMREVTCLPCYTYSTIYQGHLRPFCVQVLPRTYTLFGSAKGKFKYSFGANLFFDGYLYDDVYYSVCLGYTFLDDIHHSNGIDSLNPSQLLNVRSDIVRYLSRPGISFDNAYIQKTWNLGWGCFARGSLGLFEVEYGGAAAEFLYYPVGSSWAAGVEAACVRKRTLSGIGFSDKVRKLDRFDVSYRRFLGSQAFFNLYYDFEPAKLELRLKAGKFLANDLGIRYEISRYFPSGLRVTFWYTRTNGHDMINGERYYDKGVSLSMPLDICYTCNSRNTWRYSLAAWLRDVGAISYTGKGLYETIDDLR